MYGYWLHHLMTGASRKLTVSVVAGLLDGLPWCLSNCYCPRVSSCNATSSSKWALRKALNLAERRWEERRRCMHMERAGSRRAGGAVEVSSVSGCGNLRGNNSDIGVLPE